jgi:hypothetical protein
MKRMYLWLGINLSIAIFLTLGFTLLYQIFIPQNTEDYIFNQVISLENKEIIEAIPNTNAFEIVHASYDAISRNNQIGKVYEVHIKNSYMLDSSKGFGSIKFYVGIDLEERIFVEIIELEQTNIYLKNIKHFIERSLQRISIDELQNIQPFDAAYDLSTGATASDSTASILDILIKTAEIHFGIYEDDPWKVYFGDDYTFTTDTTSYNQVTVYTIPNKGFVFEVVESGPYEGYDGIYNGSITLQIVTNMDLEIIDIIPIQSLYGHTWSFYQRNQEYVNGFIGKKLDDLELYLDQNIDLMTSATGTKELLEKIMRILILEVNSND